MQTLEFFKIIEFTFYLRFSKTFLILWNNQESGLPKTVFSEK